MADTSTIINLNATGCAPLILKALPNRIRVVDVIPGELDTGRARGHQDAERLQQLIASGFIDLVTLGDLGWERFEELVSGTAAETLEDGEAATVAYAIEQACVAVIDEKKATKICRAKFPDVQLISTVDLLLHNGVRQALGEKTFGDALFAALHYARMAVFPQHYDDILHLIRPDQAVHCPSLPKRFRTPVLKLAVQVER